MSIRGPGFWGYRWDGYSHQELYDMVKTNAKGPAVLQEADRAWNELVGLMNESRDRIEQLQRDAGVSWEGRASTAMSESVSPLGSWAQETATAAEQSRASLQQIADGFARTSNSMPEPVAVPSKIGQGMPSSFSGLLAGQNDEDTADRQAQLAWQHAIELMNGYTDNNVASADTLGSFAEPPDIGISSAERTTAGGSAGSFIDSRSFSDSASGDDGRGGSSDLSDVGRNGDRGVGSAGPGSFGAPGGDTGSGPGGSPGTSTGNGGGPRVPTPDGFGATDPSRIGGTPTPTPTPPLPTGTSGPAGNNPFPPITGVLTDPTDRVLGNSGRPFGGTGAGPGGGSGANPGGGTPRGTGGGFGSGGSGGNPGAGQGGGAAGRGGAVGATPVTENTGVARGGIGAARPGGAAGGMGGAPMGAPGRNEEDKERNSPEYLRDFNDDFWDDTPPVAPAVIGEDDD